MIAGDELTMGCRHVTLTSPVDHGSPRLGRPSMTFHSGTTRRGFLKSSALALASLGIAPRALSAPKLNLKKPIKIGCQTILSGPLGGYGEFMRKGATPAMEEINGGGGVRGGPPPRAVSRPGAEGAAGRGKRATLPLGAGTRDPSTRQP